jgi:hypothetical protein
VFVVDEAAYVVFGGVGAGAFVTVLLDAEAYVVGESYVEAARAACKDVDVEMVFALRHFGEDSGEVGVGKQIPPLRCGMTNKRQGQMQNQHQQQKQIPSLRCGMTNK